MGIQKKYLSAVQGNSQHKDDGNDDGGDVEGNQGLRPQVPAGKDRCVGQLDQQNVNDAHGRQQQRLYGNGQAEEDGDGEVGEHAGEEDVVGEEAESVTSALWASHLHHLPSLRTGARTRRLALTRELNGARRTLVLAIHEIRSCFHSFY